MLLGVLSILLGAVTAIKRDIISGMWIGGIALLFDLLIFIFASGMQKKSLSKQVLITPNQGIRLLAREGLYGCLIGGPAALLSVWLLVSHIAVTAGEVCWLAGIRCYVPESTVILPTVGWASWLIAGILLGAFIGLMMGWDVCVQHLILRVLLWRAGSFPLNAVRFLDYAAERILLRKIGGGYIFIHRLLLEYFALAMMETIQMASRDTKDPGIYRDQGAIFATFREDDQAIKNYTRAIELNPRSVSAYEDRGLIYARQKKYLQAVADFTSAIKLDSKSAWLYRQRGLVYRELKEYENAIADYNQAIELDTEYVNAYYSRGFAFLWLKQSELACANFTKCTSLRPKDLYIAWMAVYAGLNRQHPGIEVAERLETIATVDPEHYAAHICRGVALGLRGKLHEGLAELEQALQLNPKDATALFWRGMIYAYLGQDAPAIQTIAQALDAKLPPILLTPLYWLEQEQPEMYQIVAAPFLTQYDV